MNKSKPPKDREFLGLVDRNTPYWEIFQWVTKKTMDVDKPCYTDRQGFLMPSILGWEELPQEDDI